MAKKDKAEQSPLSHDDKHMREESRRKAVQGDDPSTRFEKDIYFKQLYQSLPLQVILGRLNEDDLQLLSLRVIDGMSVKEMAAIVGKDERTVRYHWNKLQARIRARVRTLIDKDKNTQTANELMVGAWEQIYAKRKRFHF